MFLWRGVSSCPVLCALLLTAWPIVGTSSFPPPSADGWGKESRANSLRQPLNLTWANSSTLYKQLNISFSPWHKVAKARGRQGPAMRELQGSSPSFTHQFHFQTQCQFGPSSPKLLVALDAVFMIFYTKSKFYLLVKFQNFHNTHKPEFLHPGQQSHPNLLLQGPRQAKWLHHHCSHPWYSPSLFRITLCIYSNTAPLRTVHVVFITEAGHHANYSSALFFKEQVETRRSYNSLMLTFTASWSFFLIVVILNVVWLSKN